MNINKKNCIILALATLPMLNSCSCLLYTSDAADE